MILGSIDRVSESKYVKGPRPAFLHGESIELWSKQRVMAAILKLNVETPLKTAASMRFKYAPVPDPILSNFADQPTSRKFLYFASCHFFGSWNSALVACNLEPVAPAFNRFWTKDLIIKCIKHLRQDGHPLTVFSIWRDRSRRTRKKLFEVTGKATTGSALHDASRRYFGSWDNALLNSGISLECVKERPFWTKNKIVRSIKILHKEGIALNTVKIGKDSSRETASMIQKELGKKRVGRSLYGAAYRIFGSWDRALYEAGVNPSLHRRKTFGWDVRQLARILNVLHDLQVPVNASSLSKDTSDQTASIIFDLTGQRERGTFLFRLANQKLGSWDSALKHSGFWLSDIRRSGSPCERNPEKVIAMIRMFHKNKIALNPSAMITHSHHMKFFVEQNFGAAVSGSSLMSTARTLFGSWDQALWESGLDVAAILRKSRPNTSNLPIVSYQVEDVKRDGEFGLSNFLGNPSKTPEELIDDKEKADCLQDAVGQLTSEDQDLADMVFDAILQIHHYKDQNQLIQFIVEHFDHEISEARVRRIFSQLASKLGGSVL
jgi:hypothetical protein